MEDAGTTTCACLEIDPYMEGQLCVIEGKGSQPYPVLGVESFVQSIKRSIDHSLQLMCILWAILLLYLVGVVFQK